MKKITLLFISVGITLAGFSQTPLYQQNFELGLAGWTIDNTNNGSWAIGTPAAPTINSAASGNNAVVTNLTGLYNSNEDATVTSPLISIASATGKEELTMSVWWNSEFSWDGSNVFISYDGGTTWSQIGSFGAPNNWYTDNTINGAPNGSQEGWTGRGATGSGGWVTASHPLDSAMLVNNNSIILKIGFGSDGSVQDEGFAFDDVMVAEPIRSDLTAAAVNLPLQCSYGSLEPITITVCNVGDTVYNAGSIIPVAYTLNGGATINENLLLTAPLLQDSCVDYTFSALGNFSAAGYHDLTAWVAYSNDMQNGNDTVNPSIYNSSAAVPYFEDFEAGQNGWEIDNSTNGSWELGIPSGAIINSAASDSNAFVTNLTGAYNGDENSSVTSSCIDISGASGFEVLTMKVWWDCQNSWDGANLFSSYDGGTTWNQVGAMGDPNNWYNDNTINSAPSGSQEGWTGSGAATTFANGGSPGWVVAQHTLDTTLMQNSSSLLLRVGFGSDGFGSQEGFAFDDVAIGFPNHTYEYGVAGIDSVSTCEPSITLDAGAGHPFYHWAEVSNNNYGGAWSNKQTVEVSTTGNYVITVTNAAGMMATDTVFVEIKDFQAPVLTDVVSCLPGDSAEFDAGSGTTPANILYNWSTGDVTQTSWLYALGTITVTKTDTALGCFASDTAKFTDMPPVNLGIDTAICEGTSLMLNGGPFYNYLWSDSSTNQFLEVDTAGLYYVTISDFNNCTNSDSINIAINPAPNVDLGNDTVFCFAQNSVLDAGAATSYLWNDGSTNQTLMPTASGIYDVTITDANGCMDADTIVIVMSTPCVGINEYGNETIMELFPNPTQGDLTIRVADFDATTTVSVMTVYGQVVRSERITATTTTLHLNDLAEGTYLLQLKSKNAVTVNKFIINR